MSINQIPNIEHCETKEVKANEKVIGYTIKAMDGYLIHLNNGVEDTENVWVRTISISATEDFSRVEIRKETDAPKSEGDY